jgi:enamine deaminase RidA (YjgF/YER057c/UK114 family)
VLSRPKSWTVQPAFWPCIFALILIARPGVRAETVRTGLNASDHGGGAETVAVTGEALVHTAQVLAVDSKGNIVGHHDATAQADRVLDNLEAALAASGARLTATVKLNLYVRPGGMPATVFEAVKRRFPADARPAISLVETALPHPDALVAADAIATRSEPAEASGVAYYRSPVLGDGGRAAHAAVLPVGSRVYISGQAAREGDIREATVAALALLRQNLEFLGLGLSDAVQVKSFLRPMSAASSVEKYIQEFFGGKAPPLVFVEWSNAEPIEIEMIAAGVPRPQDSLAGPVEYLTPPGEVASPVFCRIVRMNQPTTIYFSSLYGQEADDESDQIRSAFNRLRNAAGRAGTDLRHLVKATYYVTTDDVGRQLTDIRKGLYDPTRPPSASKATVAGIGVKGRVFAMDLIAASVSGPDH